MPELRAIGHTGKYFWRALLLLAITCVSAASNGEDVVSSKALKYHKLLSSRPEPGYLFDRFYNTWLDESTVDALGTFLKQRANETKATPDQLLLAFFYVKKGDDVAALELFEEALATNPGNAATWYHKGLIEARTLDFEAAIADLRKARAQSPDEKLAVQIEKQLGKLLVRNRQTTEALEVWQSLLKAHPNDDELSEDLIELYIDEGLFKEAAALAESLLKETQDPHLSVMRRLRLGDIHHRAGDRQKAIEVYTNSLDDVGADTWLEREILAQVDQILRREDDLSGLNKLYGDLGTKYPKRVSLHRRRAQLLLEVGENDAGLAAFREVLKLTPGDRLTREEYVTILAKVDKHDDAVNELKSLCEQNAKDAELRFKLATLLLEAKRTDEAVEAFDEYLTASDGSEYAHLRAARALERLESKVGAERVYRDLAAKFADSASAQEAFAAFLYAQDQKKDAVQRWQAVAKGADVNQVMHVARALSARNEHKAAFEILEARHEAFSKEPLYLGQLVSTAYALKEYEKAIPWALARVELAESASDMEAAIDQAATTIERADKLEVIANERAARSDRSIPESCLLAELWERIGDSARADEVLKQPAAAGNLLAVSEQIRLASARREWAAAADATRRMLDLPGGRKSLYVRRLVELYQRDFQFEEALKWVQEWKRLSPGSTTPWVTESRLLSGLGKTDDALRVLRTAAMQFDEDEDLRVRLAEFYVESDKPADAERIYWQLYEQDDDLTSKLRWAQELAKIAQQQGTIEQIVDSYNQRIESNRQSIVPWLALSEVYRVADDNEGRRRALTAAAKIKPDDIHLLQQIARVEEQYGDWQAAIKTLERAVPLDKTSRTREQIAQLNLRYGDEDVGFEQLMELASENSDPRSLETAADSLCGMQDWRRAAGLLRDKLADHPNDYRLRYLLAVALEEDGEIDSALEQFLTLLENQEELPSTKSAVANQNTTMQSYYGMMAQIMPARAAEWIDLMQYRHSAYAHQQRRGMVTVATAASGAVRSAIQMPLNVDAVRPMSVAHAMSIGTTLDDDKQQELWRVLETHGIEHASALSHFDPSRGDFSGPIGEILEKDPDNDVALAVMVLQGMNRQDQSTAEHCERAAKQFKDSYPQLAFMAAVQAGAQASGELAMDDTETNDGNKAANPHFDHALKIAASLDSPSPIVVMAVTSALGGRPGRSVTSPIDEEYRKQFAKLMLKWYPKLTNSPWGQYAYYMVIQSLAQTDDPTAYVQFLDDEVGRFQLGGGSKSRNSMARSMMYARNQQQTLSPPTFPPTQLANFPPSVLAVFAANSDMNPFGNALTPPGGIEEPAKRIKPLLAGVKSPILRILLARHAELNDVVEREVAQLLAAKTPSVDAWLIAAALAADKEQFVETVRILEKARYLPMTQDMRRHVDSSLVGAVLSVKDNPKQAQPELLEAGRQASLRLRRARLDARQRDELIAAMEELGLKKEAEKLDALASQTATTSVARSNAVFYSGRVAQTPDDRIAKLVADGKREVAVRLLAGEVSGQVQQMLANMQNARHYGYQFRELRQRIDSLGLADEVLKSLSAGDSKNPRRILEYAVACQYFDQKDKARSEFERVLELRPKDDAARMQLILLLGPTDLKAATQHIRQLGQVLRDSFAQTLGEQLQDSEIPVDQRLHAAQLVVELAKVLKPGDVKQPFGFEYCLNNVGRQMHTNRGQNVPSLYALAGSAPESERRRLSPELLAERAKIHEELCRELLKKPETARIGFKHLLAVTEAKQASTDEFSAIANQILIDEAVARPGRGGAIQQVFYYSSNDGRDVRFRTPEEFLVHEAWKSNDWKQIDERLLPKLNAGKTREAHDELANLSKLYRCEDVEFLTLAKEVVRRAKPSQPYQSNQGMSLVLDVWADRELDVDVEPMILTQLRQEVGSQNHHQPPAYVLTYAEGLAAQANRKRQLAFLDEVATIYIAPPEKRNDFVKKNYQRNMINWGTPNGRIYVFGQLMERLIQQDELLFAVLEHLKQYDLPPVQNLEHRVRNALQRPVAQGAAATMTFLENSPWLVDEVEFETIPVAELGNQSALRALLQNIANSNEVRAGVYRQLEERQKAKSTFGGGLILAYLDQKDKRPRLLEYLGEQLPKIEKLPKEKQLELAEAAHELLYPDALDTKNLSESAESAKAWLNGGQASRANSLLARVEKAKRLEELGVEHGQIYEFARSNLSAAIASDPVAAAKVFRRVCELSIDAQRRGEWHMHFGNGNSTAGYLLQQASYNIRSEVQNWNTYNFVVDVVSPPDIVPIEIDNSVNQLIGNMISKSFQRAPKQPSKKNSQLDERMRFLYEECGQVLGDRPSLLLIRPVYERCRGELNVETCERIRSWTKTEKESGKYPRIAADLHAVAGLVANEKKSEKQKLPPGERHALVDYHQHLLRLLNDGDLPVTMRVYLATFLARIQGDLLPLKVAQQIVAVHVQAMEVKAPITDEQNDQLTRVALSLRNDASSDETLALWREKWAARYLKPRLRPQPYPQRSFENFFDLSDSAPIGNALILYYAADDTDQADQLLRKYSEQIGMLPRTLATLVRAKQIEKAAQFVRRNWPILQLNWPQDSQTYYDAEVAALLPSLYEGLQADDQRYFARLLFASMPDQKLEADHQAKPDVPKATRDARLVELATEIEDVDFKDDALRKRVLVLLSRCDATRDEAAEAVAKAYAPENLASAFRVDSNSPRLTQETELAVCHFRNRLVAGDNSQFVELVERLIAGSNEEDYQFSNRLWPLLECCRDAVRDSNQPFTAEQCAAIAAQMRAIFKDRDYIHFTDSRVFNTLLVALHAQAGEAETGNKWIRTVSENCRHVLTNGGVNEDIWKLGVKLNTPPTAENVQARLSFFENVLRYTLDRNWIKWNPSQPYRLENAGDDNVFVAVVKSGVLNEEELKSNGDDIVVQIGNVPMVMAGWAAWLQTVGEHERAAKHWQTVVDAEVKQTGMKKSRPKSGEDDAKIASTEISDRHTSYILGLAAANFDAGHEARALEAMKLLDGKKIPNSMRKSVDKLRKRMSSRPENGKASESDQTSDAKPAQEKPSKRGKSAEKTVKEPTTISSHPIGK